MLTAFGAVMAFATVVYIVTPTPGHGRPPTNQTITAADPDHQAFIEALGAMIGRSVEVLAIHPRTASPHYEVILRLTGSPQDQEFAADEVAVLSHSAVLHTIMLHTMDEAQSASESGPGLERGRSAGWPGMGSSVEPPSPLRLTRMETRQPGFFDRWRSMPNVTPRLLARGISDIQLEFINGAAGRGHAGVATIRLVLTWSPDSADGEDEAAILVKVAGDAVHDLQPHHLE